MRKPKVSATVFFTGMLGAILLLGGVGTLIQRAETEELSEQLRRDGIHVQARVDALRAIMNTGKHGTRRYWVALAPPDDLTATEQSIWTLASSASADRFRVEGEFGPASGRIFERVSRSLWMALHEGGRVPFDYCADAWRIRRGAGSAIPRVMMVVLGVGLCVFAFWARRAELRSARAQEKLDADRAQRRRDGARRKKSRRER